MLLQVIVNGVAVGCVYGLVALGFVLIYKATELVNFAQGDLLMLGAFVAYTFIELFGLGYWLGAALTIATMIVFGALLDKLVLRRVLGQPQFAIIMLTVGLGFVPRAAVGVVPGWGVQPHTIDTPFTGKSINAAGLMLTLEHLSIIVGTAVVCLLLFAFFRYTRLGMMMQAASQNQLAAYCMGIPVARIYSLVFGIGAGIAALGGILIAPITFIEPNMGFIVLVAFPAAILGGFTSPAGAIVGGVIIGVVEQLAGLYFTQSVKNIAPYALLLLVLAIRPEGLFGAAVVKKV